MARRIPIALVAGFVFLGIPLSAQTTPSVLVQYSFDDSSIETGPDTFAVFQNAKGSVRLSTQNHFSGYHSIEVRDVAGGRDFPELQGYFQLRTHGKVFAHFALMITNSADELNIALAGPQWFALRKDGIGFWLKTIDGYLCQYSDSMPKKLFAMTPFVWYVVNVAYDIDAGMYDLVIYEETRQDPVISLRNQANASKQAGSAVDKFSFIGDTGTDESNVVYYVDDVIVGVDESLTQLPFAAPGRRKLFIDYWNDYQSRLRDRPIPMQLMELSDLGIQFREIESLKDAGLWELLQRSLRSGRAVTIPANAAAETRSLLEAVNAWNAGTRALRGGQPADALKLFEAAARLVPAGKIYSMDAVLSIAALGQWQRANDLLAQIYPAWRDDMRFPIAAAMIGIARQDLATAEQWLRDPAEQYSSKPAQELIASQYFYVLLWQKKITEAQRFAAGMADFDAGSNEMKSIWVERLADTAFMSGDFGTALRLYEESLGSDSANPEIRILMKLSDVYFRLGDVGRERHYRELVYGRLGS